MPFIFQESNGACNAADRCDRCLWTMGQGVLTIAFLTPQFLHIFLSLQQAVKLFDSFGYRLLRLGATLTPKQAPGYAGETRKV